MKKAQKFFISTILTLIFCLGAMGVTSFFASKNEVPYTQEYINYLNLSDEEKKLVNIVPQKYPTVINSLNKKYLTSLNNYVDTYSLETYYNLKDEITLYTDNQAHLGICWAYASVKSLETFLALKYGELWNFSEGFVAYAKAKNYSGTQIDSGGNWHNFIGTMNSYGILSETFLPYENMNSITNDNMQYYSYLEQYADQTYNKIVDDVSIPVNESGIGAVKSHIKQNGSLYIAVNSHEIKTGNNDYIVSNAKAISSDHAVSLIGWDDNFSASNFPSEIRPSQNGAFLALNSWGTEWGDNGVFYISYEDIQITNGYLSGFISKPTSFGEVLKFDEISSPTSTYNNYDTMTNIFNIGDSVNLVYNLQSTLGTAPNVEIKIKKNSLDITNNFLVNQSKTQTETNITISTVSTLKAGTYTVELKNNNNTYIRSFVIVSGAEISYISTNFGKTKMFNTINGQVKTFSANYSIAYLNGANRMYIDLLVYIDILHNDIESIDIDGTQYLIDNTNISSRFSAAIIVDKQIYDMNVTTYGGITETYKIFVVSSQQEELYYINYHLDGGTNDQLNPTLFDTVSENYTLKTPIKPNYTFEGWYINQITPESQITQLTTVNPGNILLIAKWAENQIDYNLISIFRDENSNIVQQSQGLIYGYTVDLTANFDYLQENNLILNWYINSIHYDIYDLQTSINLKIQVGTFTIECVAIKNGATLASQETSFTAEKKVLLLSWQETNFVYNGQNQSPSASVTGLIGTDTYPLNYVYELDNQVATNSILAGEYKVAVTNLSNQNYVIEENFEKIYTIEKANLTISWQETNFVYNGQNQSPSASVTGLIGTDTYPLNYVYELENQVATNSILAGEYKVAVTNLSNQNYVIEENFEKIYTIEKANLTISWQETNFVYNGQNQSPSASVTGLIGTDTYPLNYVYKLENQVVTNSILAGEYKVAVTNLSNQNYVIEENFEKTYTIDKANLTINIIDVTQKFSDNLIDVTQKFELVGVIYNSEMSVIVTTNAIAHKAGTYEITVQNNTHQNYNITINSGTYTILEGKTFTYELPSGEKLVHYINQGEQPPSIDTIYKPEFTIVSLKEIKNENGNITYQVIEVALLPIILISAPILLVILFSIMSIMRKRRKRWQY